jgi:hypothetical protein
MSGSTYVDRLTVSASLRSRDLHSRADWVDRELPAFIDIVENASLLRTLGIDLAAVSTSEPVLDEVAAEHSQQ